MIVTALRLAIAVDSDSVVRRLDRHPPAKVVIWSG